MARVSRQTRNKRPGLESWLKWQLNEFRIFESPSDPWSKEEARTFYRQNKEAIHRAAKVQNREEALQDWIGEVYEAKKDAQ